MWMKKKIIRNDENETKKKGENKNVTVSDES